MNSRITSSERGANTGACMHQYVQKRPTKNKLGKKGVVERLLETA